MADKKITELSAYSSPIGADLLAIVDSTLVVTKKITLADLTSFFGFWQLGGNTNGAEEAFGNVDDFDIPFIINNEEVGKWIRVNSSIMGLDLGVASTRAGNLQLHTTISATPWLSADESNGVKIRDFYGLGLAGNLVAFNAYNNMASAIYAATANSQVAIITNKSIGIGHVTSSTYDNTDAVDGNALHLGDTNLSVRNAVTQPTTPYVNGFLLYSKDRAGAGTASPFILTENGTLIDLVGLALGGGSIPAGTTGQTLYYASAGTTVTPTSNLYNDGTNVAIGQPATNLFQVFGGANLYLEIDVANDKFFANTLNSITFTLNGVAETFIAGGNRSGIEANNSIKTTTIGDYQNNGNGTIVKIDDTAETILYDANVGHRFTGNVGIQTAPTANALEVLGNVFITGDAEITGKLTVAGAIDPTHLYLDEQGGDPSNVANKGILYTKDVGGVTQLFYEDSAGTVSALTATGGAGANKALSNLASVAINTDLLLGTSDGGALGSTTKMWSDLFLADGAVINFNNGDVTITHGTNTILFEGGISGYKFDSPVVPKVSDGASLGNATLKWSDIWLDNGAVINFNGGDVLITHSSNLLAFSGATSGYTFDVPIGLASGGSNKNMTAVNGGIVWTDADSMEVSAAGTQNQLLRSNGAAAPSFVTVPIGPLVHTTGNGNTVAASTTAYGQFFFGSSTSATENLRQIIIGAPCTIKSLYVKTLSAQPASGAMTVTIRKNGAGTALTLTIPLSSAAGTFTDLVNSFTAAAGDLLSIEFVNAATGNSASVLSITCWMFY